ncbi:MAG: hypothetical protein RSC92_02100 [Clostridia bacterium]
MNQTLYTIRFVIAFILPVERNESISFKYGDLFYSLYSTYLNVIVNKQIQNKWNLDVILFDIYDFTDFKEINEYVGNDSFKGFFGSTGNNIAMIATSSKVVNTYNITIKFKLENWEVM